MFNLGTLLAKLGEDEKAVEQFRLSIDANPEQRDAHFNLGNALRRLKQFPEAAEHFRHVVKHYPGDEQARLALALCLIRLHEYDAARTHLDESRAAVPDSDAIRVTHLRLLATVPRDAAKDPRQVLEEVEKLLAAQAENGKGADANLLLTKAFALAQFERWQEAIQVAELLVKEVSKMGNSELVAEFQVYLDGFRTKARPAAPWPDNHPNLEPRPLNTVK